MISSALLNVILSIGGVAILVAAMRFAYLAAGGRLHEPRVTQPDLTCDLERAA